MWPFCMNKIGVRWLGMPMHLMHFVVLLRVCFIFLNQCEKRPKGFPKSESWVMFPQEKIDWSFYLPAQLNCKMKADFKI